MRKAITGFVLMLCATGMQAQKNIVPGGNAFEGKWLKNEKYQMDCFMVEGNQKSKYGTFSVEVKVNSNTLSVITNLRLPASNETVTDTSISGATQLNPIYRSSNSKTKRYALHFDKEVTGYYMDKVTGKTTTVKESLHKNVFDGYLYPYLLGTLSLEPGFKGKLAAYNFKPENKTRVHDVNINQVESATYRSRTEGARSVWKVNVVEEVNNDAYSYYVDKESRKLWKIDILTGGRRIELVTSESRATVSASGNATITGQVFARDNENEGLLKGMAVLNVNKKQYAPAGTPVYLVPATPYFEEFKQRNKKGKAKTSQEPLLPEFEKLIRTVAISDDKGNYEISDVPEGPYYLVVAFGYRHTHRGTETVGQTDVYVNGNYQGSNPINRIYSETQNASAYIEKKITVEKNQKVVKQNLKKTL